MQLVINIDEEKYKWLKEHIPKADKNSIVGAVVHGTPIPKGHGRLIDADAINLKNISPVDGFSVYGATAEDIDLTPTVLEADEVEE